VFLDEGEREFIGEFACVTPRGQSTLQGMMSRAASARHVAHEQLELPGQALCPCRVDAVEKVVDDLTKPFRLSILGLFLSRSSFLFWLGCYLIAVAEGVKLTAVRS
jgi:hypothetical protein